MNDQQKRREVCHRLTLAITFYAREYSELTGASFEESKMAVAAEMLKGLKKMYSSEYLDQSIAELEMGRLQAQIRQINTHERSVDNF